MSFRFHGCIRVDGVVPVEFAHLFEAFWVKNPEVRSGDNFPRRQVFVVSTEGTRFGEHSCVDDRAGKWCGCV